MPSRNTAGGWRARSSSWCRGRGGAAGRDGAGRRLHGGPVRRGGGTGERRSATPRGVHHVPGGLGGRGWPGPLEGPSGGVAAGGEEVDRALDRDPDDPGVVAEPGVPGELGALLGVEPVV